MNDTKQFKVGQVWADRSGRKHTIEYLNESALPIESDTYLWREGGLWLPNGTPHDLDLVTLVKDVEEPDPARAATPPVTYDRVAAAIALKVPRSGVPEIDDMIRESLRNDDARAALTGIISNSACDPRARFETVAANAFAQADVMLAARNKEEVKP